MVKHDLRPGNRALDHVLANYPGSPTVSHLTQSIPTFASLLRDQADETADTLFRSGTNLVSRFVSKFNGKRKLLGDCIIDLMLVGCFDELAKYCGDNELASLLVDGIVFEATGCEASTPTESEVLYQGTQEARGLSKYVLGRRLLSGSEVEARMFGKEYSALLTGRPLDIAAVLGVHPLTILIRGNGKMVAEYCLYGTLPREDYMRTLEALFDKSRRRLGEITASTHSKKAE